MEPTRRHPQEPQERLQREVLAGPIHGAQEPAECPWRKLGFLHATSSIAFIAHVYRAEKPLRLDALKHLRETDQQ